MSDNIKTNVSESVADGLFNLFDGKITLESYLTNKDILPGSVMFCCGVVSLKVCPILKKLNIDGRYIPLPEVVLCSLYEKVRKAYDKQKIMPATEWEFYNRCYTCSRCYRSR